MKNLAALGMLAFATSAAQADNFLVTTNSDGGPGSLRQAIIDANDAADVPHTISFSGGLYPTGSSITLVGSLPDIEATDLTIVGGAAAPVIDGGGVFQIMYATLTVQKLHLKDIELSNGYSSGVLGQGGACLGAAGGSGGDLTLERVIFRGCTLSTTGLAWGAAVRWSRSAGSVDIIDSRFLGNYAEVTTTGQGGGGALSIAAAHLSIEGSWFENNATIAEDGSANGGAIYVSTSNIHTVWVGDSSFIDNDASPGRSNGGAGGAIYLSCADCFVQLERNWFRGNAANTGGAIYMRQGYSSPNLARLVLNNSSFYNHLVTASGGAVVVGSNTELAAGNNSFYSNSASDGAHLSFSGSADVLAFRANLLAPVGAGAPCSGSPGIAVPGAVRLNVFSDGGCSLLNNQALPSNDLGSFQLEESSFGNDMSFFWFDGGSVIDAIADSGACEAGDVLGNSRPIDGDGDTIARCDVGAFEKYWVLIPPVDAWVFIDGFED
ncbi:MAG: hypothetical protein R3F22_03580 [Lysobacteraceae bacterium]